jgi:paraquat-inducible protein A
MSRTEVRPAKHAARERVACPNCGLAQSLARGIAPVRAECRRCHTILELNGGYGLEVPLAFAAASLLLFIAANLLPLLRVEVYGAARQSWLFGGVAALWSEGFPLLALLVGSFTIALPLCYFALSIWTLSWLQGASRPRGLGAAFRWAAALRPWAMTEVYLIGAYVAYTRLEAISAVHVGSGGWCYLAASLAWLAVEASLDERKAWRRIAAPAPPPSASLDEPVIACTECELIAAGCREGARCPRCGSRLFMRKPASLARTAALVIAAGILYVPANLLPVVTIQELGWRSTNTIMGGIEELVQARLWPLAVIVFLASVLVPLLKLGGLGWFLLAVRSGSRRRLVARSLLHRAIDAVGRWSNIDVFVAALMASLVQFGQLAQVRIEPGLVAFAAVVVLTMLASKCFDPRLMWDAPDPAHGRIAERPA